MKLNILEKLACGMFLKRANVVFDNLASVDKTIIGLYRSIQTDNNKIGFVTKPKCEEDKT